FSRPSKTCSLRRRASSSSRSSSCCCAMHAPRATARTATRFATAPQMLQPRWQNIAFVVLGVFTLSYFMHNVYGRDLIRFHVAKGCRRVGPLTGLFAVLGTLAALWSVALFLLARRQKRWLKTVGIVRSLRTSTTVCLLCLLALLCQRV